MFEGAKVSGFRKGVWGITLFPLEKGFPQEAALKERGFVFFAKKTLLLRFFMVK